MKTLKCRPVLIDSKDKSSVLVLDDNSHKLNLCEPNEAAWGHKQLILISLDLDEKIKVGDTFLADDRNTIHDKPIYSIQRCKAIQNEWIFGDDSDLGYNPDWSKKVIATQSQLSPEYIQQFIEEYNKGEVKDVEIKMEESLTKVYDNIGGHSGGHWEPNGFQPKLTNGFVTIVEKDYIDTIGKCANCGVKFHIHKSKEPITYTEEEVKILLNEYFIFQWDHELSDDIFEEWFEEHKKK